MSGPSDAARVSAANPTGGLKILKTPIRTPAANPSTERWIGSIRRLVVAA